MVATPTYVALVEVTLVATATSVTLPVPSGYRDVVLVIQGTTSVDTLILARFNSDSGANYSYVQMYGNGSSAGSGASTASNLSSIVLRTGVGQNTVQIMDYSATDKHKSVLIRRDHAGADTVAAAERWASTAAITSISLATNTGTYNAGCTFNLYGIEA